MIKTKLQLTWIVLLTIPFFYACKKEKTESNTIKAEFNYDKLLKGRWMMISATISPALNGDTDLFKSYPPCFKDDTVFFKKDSVFLRKTGMYKCNTIEQDTMFYTWNLKDDSIIELNGAESTILLLDDKKLVVATKQMINSKEYINTTTYDNIE